MWSRISPEHLSSSPVFSRDYVARSLVFCVMFVIFRLSFDLRILITPLWYLQAFLANVEYYLHGNTLFITNFKFKIYDELQHHPCIIDSFGTLLSITIRM
jgi:hypothetical protein